MGGACTCRDRVGLCKLDWFTGGTPLDPHTLLNYPYRPLMCCLLRTWTTLLRIAVATDPIKFQVLGVLASSPDYAFSPREVAGILARWRGGEHVARKTVEQPLRRMVDEIPPCVVRAEGEPPRYQLTDNGRGAFDEECRDWLRNIAVVERVIVEVLSSLLK